MTKAVLVINANPLLNVVYPGTIHTGEINRVPFLEMHAEGKGVNVARVLSRFGHPVTVSGFAGGHSGAWLRDLIRLDSVEDAFIDTRQPLRVGFMGGSSRQDHPTSVLPQGFRVTVEECDQLIHLVRQKLSSHRLMIISGSVPSPEANMLYIKLIKMAQSFDIPCWLDVHGSALDITLGSGIAPDLCKPNLEEWGESTHWGSVPELHITDGSQPVRISSRTEGHWTVAPPNIQQVNPIGCGDCYLAGLAHGWLEGYCMEGRLRIASAAGAANALRTDVAMISPEDVEPLLDQVSIRRIEG